MLMTPDNVPIKRSAAASGKPRKKKHARRGNGSGSVFHDKTKDRWAYTHEVPTTMGETRRKIRRYAETQAEAQVKLEELRARFRNGGDVIADRRTVDDLLGLWIKNHFAKLKPNTCKSYRDNVDRFIRPFLGSCLLRSVRTEHIDAFLIARVEEGMSRSGRNYLRVVVGALFGYGVRLGWIEKNVVQQSTSLPKQARQLTCWSGAERASFLAAAKGTTLEDLFRFALGTGCRMGEVLGLRWSSVDFQEKRIHIERQLQDIDERDAKNADVEHLVDRWYLLSPKSTTAIRIVEPGAAVIEMLRRREGRASDRPQPERTFGLVFTAANSMPMSMRNVRKHFEKLIRRSGVPRIRLHDLRHTTATLLLEDGVAAHVVQRLLGHADVATTLRAYAHVTQRQTEDVSRRLSALATADG